MGFAEDAGFIIKTLVTSLGGKSQFLGCMFFSWKGPWASWLLLQVNEISSKLEKSALPETLEEATLLQRGFFIKSLFAR